jgi:hypothetical protein
MLKEMQMLPFYYYYYIKERCGRGQGAEATHDSPAHTLNQSNHQSPYK